MIPGISKVYRLAAAALYAAVDDNWPKASRAAQRINDECGPDAVIPTLIAWCDALHAHATDGDMTPVKIKIGHMAIETGAIDRDVPDRIQWAGRLIRTRLAMDEDAFYSILKEANGTDKWSQCVSGVLESVAATIRCMPRGYVRIGGA